MKTLNTYLVEGLFKNVGIGSEALKQNIIDWINENNYGFKDKIKIEYKDNKFIVNTKSVWLNKAESVNNNGMFEWGDEIQEFSLTGNKNITTLEGCPKKCFVFRCDQCSKLKSLKGAPQECVTFDAHQNNITELEGIENLKCEEVIDLSFCDKLKSLKGCPKACNRLDIYACRKLKNFEGCPDCTNINATSCNSLESVKGIGKNVTKLQLENCENLKTLEDLPKTCKRILLYNCKKLNKSTIKIKNIDIIE